MAEARGAWAGYRIMVVDDHIDTRESAGALLSARGYVVVAAASAPEALDMTALEAPDLYLVDVHMPGMTGMQLLKQLAVECHDYEAVIITGHESLADAQKAMQLGARSYLVKPVGSHDLFRHVEEALEALVRKRRERLRMQSLQRDVSVKAEELAVTQRVLEHKDLLLDALFSSIGEGLIAVDGDNRVMLLNPAAERILGIRFAQCAGAALFESVEDPQLLRGLRDCLERKGGTMRTEANGGRSYHVGVSPFRDRAGNLRGQVVNLVDQTDVIRAREHAEWVMSVLAHELRTPVTILNTYAAVLECGDPKPRQRREILREMHSTAGRLRDLIGTIIGVAALGKTAARLKLCRTGLGMVVRFQCDLLGSEAMNRGVRISVDPALDRLTIETDPQVLGIALRSLVSNGIKHNRAGGALSITLESEEMGVVAVSFADEGEGLPDDVRRYLFGDENALMTLGGRRKEGIGAGLYLVKRAMSLLGGRIEVRGSTGGGTAVVLVLCRGASPREQ